MGSLPLWANVALFALGAAAIWRAGTALERYTDVIALRTTLGREFAGLLLLAGATSLPELATTLTAILLLDNATLAVHNLLGGVALQTAILVWADAVKGRPGALTFFSPRFVLLIEGVGLLLLLQLVLAGIVTSEVSSVGHVSVWLALLAVAYVVMMVLVFRYRGAPRWTPDLADDFPEGLAPDDARAEAPTDDRPLSAIWTRFGLMSAVVLVGGWLAAETADVLADETGLGDAFLGATLLALATSLPEVSTTTAAVRGQRYAVAFSNIFGSNAFDVTLLFVAEVLYTGGTVMSGGDASLVLVTAVASSMTCLYLWGLLERENRTVLGVGWDSVAVGLVYVGGMIALYFV
ncbi:MAG: sodium:calcium antiporter [Gemmatimonadales bacterium]